MARNSMFDNPRFADEANQPGVRPAIPDIQPVVDSEGAVGIEAAAGVVEMGLDLKDMYTIESLRSEFEDTLAEETQGADSTLRDRFVSGLSTGDAGQIEEVSKQLTRLSLAEKQGLMGSKSAIKTRQAEIVRRAISDNPWLAPEIRSLAQTYNVAGFAKTGSGDSPNDPFIEAENEVLEAAYRLELAGVPIEDRAALIKQAALSEQQWQTIETRHKGKFVDKAYEQVTIAGGIFESEFNKTVEQMRSEGSYNEDQLMASVEKFSGDLRNRIKQGLARAQASGATYNLSEAEIDNLVNGEVKFYESAIKSGNPRRMIEERNALRLAQGIERWSTSNTLFGNAFAVTQDAEAALAFVDKFGRMYDAMGNISPAAISRLSPADRAIYQLLTSPDPTQVNLGIEQAVASFEQGQTGGQAGAGLAVAMGTMALLDPEGAGKAGTDARKALDMLLNIDGNLSYQMMSEYVPPEGQDGLPAFVVPPLKNKMVRDEVRNVDTLHGEAMAGFGSGFFNTTDAEPIMNLVFDGQKDRFVVVDKEGNPVSSGITQTGKVLRSVNQLNHIYNVRKKWGMWEGEGRYDNRTSFIDWATQGSQVAGVDDAGLPDPNADLAADHAFARKRHEFLRRKQQQDAGITTINPEEIQKLSNPLIRHTIIRSEGGYQNDSNDSGNWTGGEVGAGRNVGTNMGITPVTLANARGVDVSEITAEDMRNLSADEAESIYENAYLKGPKIDTLPSENLKGMVFDMGVVMGPRKAIQIMQEALGVEADGVIGPQTLFAARNVEVSTLRDAYADYFRSIATGKREKFLRGWLNRLNNTVASYYGQGDESGSA